MKRTNGLQGKSQTEQAYAYLKEQILNCEFLPGQEIFEKELSATLPWGRTPLHEALLLLKNDGLVDIFPRKGMRITDYTPHSVRDIYQIRKLLEPSVAQSYKHIYAKDKLLEFEENFTHTGSFSDAEYYNLDICFHTYLIQVTQNPMLMQLWEEVMLHQFRLAMYAIKLSTTFRPDNDPQHKRIIEALLKEDNHAIEESLVSHINYSLLSSLKAIQAKNNENNIFSN